MTSDKVDVIPTDRIMVKKMGKVPTERGFFVPETARTEKSRKAIWYAKIVKFGLDTNAAEAYNLQVGDIIGIEPLGQDCDTIVMDDGEFVFIPQEFIAMKDDGQFAAAFAKSEEANNAVCPS